MPQPQKYERSRDFTKQEAHKTDHAGINAELDNAATTIDALRVRQALLLNDQDQLRAKLIQRVNLSDDVIEDITSGVASGLRESVESAQSAARASLTFAEDATTQAAQALRSATQAQTTLDAAAITVAQAQAAMRDAGDVLGFVQQHAAATDPHAAAGYVKQQQIDSSLAAHQQATDPHAQYIDQQRGDVRYAPLASPALTGTPTAPTATPGTDDTQIATTAFAKAEAAAVAKAEAAAVAVSFASSAENAAGTVEGKAVDPLGIREAFNATGSAPIYACRAWVNFNGTGAVAIRARGNVSSITDNGTGAYAVNFINPMPDANYAIALSAGSLSGLVTDQAIATCYEAQTTYARLWTQDSGGPTAQDASLVCAAFFR